MEEDWKNIKYAILSAADQIIGKKQFRRNQDWFDQECMDAIRIKNAARLKMLERYTRRTREDYNKKRRSAKRICRDKKKAAFGRRLENINKHHAVHKTRELYGKIKQERTGFYPRMYNIKSELGELLSESEDIKARWRTYFEDVFNGEKNELRQHTPQTALEGCEEEENEEALNPPDYTEMNKAIQNLKNWKAPGEDTITAELLKSAGSECYKRIYNLIFKIWMSEEMPKEWKDGLILLIHKKGTRLECANYRPITFLNVTYKILSKIINNRLKIYAENCITNYQCGLKPNKSTTNHIFTIRQSMEKCYYFLIFRL